MNADQCLVDRQQQTVLIPMRKNKHFCHAAARCHSGGGQIRRVDRLQVKAHQMKKINSTCVWTNRRLTLIHRLKTVVQNRTNYRPVPVNPTQKFRLSHCDELPCSELFEEQRKVVRLVVVK